jgi:hypothetical protein
MDRNETIKRIKTALQKRSGKQWSVTKIGKYAATPHKTIGEIIKLAEDRVRAGEPPVEVAADLIEGYELGYQSSNSELVEDAARLAEGTTLAAAEPVRGKSKVHPMTGLTMHEISEENARLTAKNAALLATLEDVLRYCVTVKGFPDANRRTLEQQRAYDNARAAISSARGESLAAKFEAGWQKSIAAGSVRRGQS